MCLLVMLRLGSTRAISFNKTLSCVRYSGLREIIQIIAWIASHTMRCAVRRDETDRSKRGGVIGEGGLA